VESLFGRPQGAVGRTESLSFTITVVHYSCGRVPRLSNNFAELSKLEKGIPEQGWFIEEIADRRASLWDKSVVFDAYKRQRNTGAIVDARD